MTATILGDLAFGPGRTAVELTVIKTLIVQHAVKEHAAYRQYDGFYDGPEWSLVRLIKPVKTKAGQHFHAGDYAIVKPCEVIEGVRTEADAAKYACAYSARTGWNVNIHRKYFVEVSA